MNSLDHKRRLSAIMFTDIIGYTALMQESEESAAAVRTLHRHVFDNQHAIHNGQILQYFGDGTLSIFQSGIQAIKCAISIQKEFEKGNKVPLRIGLHMGDIVYDGTEIFGDSVNLAARIESLGIAGAVLLSAKLNDELKNHPQISTISLGRFEFKNVKNPVEVFAVQSDELVVPRGSQLKGISQSSTKTIAVLPFVNMSASEDNEYFSDGMTEEIINALAKIKGLKVTSRTSSFHFKNKSIPISEIGEALNVSTILEGSIRLSKNKMRITAQLIDVKEDFHFWSETFDRSLDDIFAVQDEISLLIADKLREHIGHFDIDEHLVDAPDISVSVYKEYLKSRYHILKMTKPELEKGISALKIIVQKQPDFALAHLGIHLGYTLLGTIGLMPAMQAFSMGRPHLDKAIELNENLPECQLHLSYDLFLPKWDLKGAYEHLQKSFELRPTVEYYQSMASMLVSERKIEAALNYIDSAIQIDPFSVINFHLKGFIFYIDKKYKKAIGFYRKALDIDSEFMASKLFMGQALILSNQPQEALEYFQSLPAEANEDVMKLGGTTMAHAALGNTNEALNGIALLEKARDSSLSERAMDMLILCQGMLKRRDTTLELINEGIDVHLPMLVYILIDPILEWLRPDDQFQKLIKAVFGEQNSFRPTKRKYKKSLLDEASIRSHRQNLEQLMKEEKPYLDPELTLRGLAALLNLQPNYMSQLLNEGFDKNFSEYINTYRLEAFKSKIAKPANSHITLLGLAYESGFNSKTVFNTYFKKTMGMTPKAYWKEVMDKS